MAGSHDSVAVTAPVPGRGARLLGRLLLISP